MSAHNANDLTEIRALQAELKKRLDADQAVFTELAQRLWAQQEAEKARLSRELHDGVGQLLTGLTRKLNSLSGAEPELIAARELAEMALADVRQLSRLMSPTILKDLGLKPAISWLCRSLLDDSGIEYDCDINLPETLPDAIAILLFRIAQEALVNCVKHSQANKASVRLAVHHNVVRMDIIDNGQGFDTATTPTGVGLGSMADRARAFQARYELASAPQQGTRITVAVPL